MCGVLRLFGLNSTSQTPVNHWLYTKKSGVKIVKIVHDSSAFCAEKEKESGLT